MRNDRSRLSVGTCVAALAVIVGCASQQQMLAGKQSMAMQVAASRGQFEMSCPQASPVLLSSEMTQPALQGPWVGGVERAADDVVICPEAASPSSPPTRRRDAGATATLIARR